MQFFFFFFKLMKATIRLSFAIADLVAFHESACSQHLNTVHTEDVSPQGAIDSYFFFQDVTVYGSTQKSRNMTKSMICNQYCNTFS